MIVELDLIRSADSASPPGWTYRPEARGSLRRALGLGIPREEWIPTPIGAFLIRHPERGPILIDTGLSVRATEDLAGNFRRLNAWFFRTMRTRPEQAVAEQLRARGIEPKDVKLIVMTHLHVDHTSGMHEFPQATFVSSLVEWAAATSRFAVLNGYIRRHLPERSRMQLIHLEAEGSPTARSAPPSTSSAMAASASSPPRATAPATCQCSFRRPTERRS